MVPKKVVGFQCPLPYQASGRRSGGFPSFVDEFGAGLGCVVMREVVYRGTWLDEQGGRILPMTVSFLRYIPA